LCLQEEVNLKPSRQNLASIPDSTGNVRQRYNSLAKPVKT